uniref:Uncharacterized protein ycf18 n=1 Tax=Herposiphonia versicolor TaxID=2007163 RepID=A0A1Z1MFH3_9FLOR|nr:phycobilisome degradation protein [Herposiphonia versicolor]ARW64733.1 phycobilisome degradation protein [Herposiphonia versicolor]
MNKLNLEQEFKIALYTKIINKLSKNNTKKYLIYILKQMMIKDNVIKYCIKTLIN